MQQLDNESTITLVRDGPAQLAKKHYHPPTLRDYGNVRNMTLTNAAGPGFDGGGGANIYAS